MNYWIKMCKFGSQVSQHWPQLGLPQMALWHHVGVTIGITLDKNGSLYDPAGTESCDMQIRLVSYLDKDEYIYIYIGLRRPPAATYNCAQVHHRSPAGTFTRVPGRCLHWSPTPPGPRWSPAYIYIIITSNRSFTSIQTVHTHTLPPAGWCA